jgi:pimeloyl-ACP methyl ester carboxylesterase
VKIGLFLIGVLLVSSAVRAEDLNVRVNGHIVHLDVVAPAVNPKLPTVVFESGLGGTGTRDWRRVVPLMSPTTCFVRYDRPGLGGSEPDGELPTPRHIAEVLHEALKRAAVTPPYLLVGHSLGGARIRMFAALYPSDVKGLVLVDPTADFLRNGPDDDLRDIFLPLGLGEKERDEMRAAQYSPPNVPQPIQDELEMAQGLTKDGFREFKTLPPLSDMPVVVLVGESNAEWPTLSGLSFDFNRWVRQWQAVRIATLRHFAESLPDGTFVETPDSSHAVHNSEPELVAWAIQRAMYPNVLRRLQRAFAAGGVESLTREYGAVKAYYPEHEIDDEALNYTGDRLMTTDRHAGIALFELNVNAHPRSSRAHEFLADAYATDGRRELAIEQYNRAVALDGSNASARSKLATLRR